LLRGDYT